MARVKGEGEKKLPTRELAGLRWKPMWISHVGCVKPCLDYLGMDVSVPWLFGATGYAFMLNVHEGLCPSGWHVADFAGEFFRLGRNVGFTVVQLGEKPGVQEDLRAKQTRAWEGTRKAIDAASPCYGYDLEIGDYYIVYGYDDTGYYYSGPRCDAGKGPLPWQDLGATGQVKVMIMNVVKPTRPADDVKTIKDALEFAVKYAKGGAEPNKLYVAGLRGYDQWIHSLESGKADGYGTAHNAVCYAECRRFAVEFLKEARERLRKTSAWDAGLDSLFDEAIGRYETVAQNLQKVADTFPFFERKPEHIKDPERCRAAVESLKAAKNAEESGLISLDKIAGRLAGPSV